MDGCLDTGKNQDYAGEMVLGQKRRVEKSRIREEERWMLDGHI